MKHVSFLASSSLCIKEKGAWLYLLTFDLSCNWGKKEVSFAVGWLAGLLGYAPFEYL